MKPVMNNTKNNMFTDEHLMWKIIALVFYIKRHNTESHLLYIYISIYRDIYTNSYAYRHAQMFMCITTHIYTIIWLLLSCTYYVEPSPLVS